MGTSYRNFTQGIALTPNATTQNNTKGDLETLTTDNKLHFFGTINDALVTETGAATITNKILTGNTAVNLVSGSGTFVLNTSGTVTVPNGTDTLANLSGVQTFTNKLISGASNTLSNIPNASLVNSSITINGNTVSLGGSTTITSSTTSTLTIGTGLSGGSFNGSTPVTIAVDSTIATLTGSQVLTDKTIDGSLNTLSNISNAQLSTMPANTIKGNNTGITGSPLDLTISQVQTLLSVPTSGSPLPVNAGGTGLGTLTANNVILGNGTSSPTFVAPGSAGSVLTSNGTTWTSSPAGASTYKSHSFKANGRYRTGNSVDEVILFPFSATIIAVWIYNGTTGTSGTTEFDLKVATTSGGSYSSILSTTGKVTSTAASNTWTDSNAIVSGQTGITKPIVSTTAITAGSAIRFDILQTMPGASDCEMIIQYQ